MALVDDYKQTVLTSKLLSPYQRDAMLDGVEEYPQEYLVAITEILTGFDKRSEKRMTEYKEKLIQAFDRYGQTIGSITDLDPTQRNKLLTQAITLKNVLISNL